MARHAGRHADRARLRRPRRAGLGRADAGRARSRCSTCARAVPSSDARTPEDYGLAPLRRRRSSPAAMPQHNARALRAVLSGEDRGPHRDCLLLGAALALEVAGEAAGPREAIERAAAGDRQRRRARACSRRLAASRGPAKPGARMSGDFLEQMAPPAGQRVARGARRAARRRSCWRRRWIHRRRRRCACSRGGFDLIAELKLRSPAVGQLAGADEDVVSRACTAYAGAGAAAVSVLTEPTRFDGASSICERRRRRCHRCACRPCARTSWSIPTRCSRRALPGPAACSLILRMLSEPAARGAARQAQRAGAVRAARGVR